MQASLNPDCTATKEFILKSAPAYRQEIAITFNLGAADKILIDAAACTCNMVFSPYEYDAHAADAGALKAGVKAQDGLLLFTLAAPHQVRRVQLNQPDQDCRVLDICRMDGARAAAQPTVQTCNALDLADDFTDMRFAVRAHHIADGQDNVENLNPARLSQLMLRSFPTGPRLGIAPAGKPEEAVFPVHAPGEKREGFTFAQDQAAALAQALQNAIDRWFSLEDDARKKAEAKGEAYTRPDEALFTLVLASDAPCRLTIHALTLAYHRVCTSFTAGGKQVPEKQVLRLGKDNPDTGTVAIRLPGGAVIHSATISMDTSLAGPRPLSAPAGLPEKAAPQGLYLEENIWNACPIRPTQALSIARISVPVLGLSPNTGLAFELREDDQGRPAGRCLAAGNTALPQGLDEPCILALKPQVLNAATYWLALKCTLGNAVWLAEASGTTPACQKDADGIWRDIPTALSPRYRLFSSDTSVTGSSCGLELNGIPITALPTMDEGPGGQPAVYDIQNSLQNILTGTTGMVDIILNVHVLNPGVVSIYPPCIIYDLNA